jgi:predicted HAD superfamily phosphohydrolase YqeG
MKKLSRKLMKTSHEALLTKIRGTQYDLLIRSNSKSSRVQDGSRVSVSCFSRAQGELVGGLNPTEKY